MSWTKTIPGPVPPGPADNVTTADSDWNQWGQGLINLAWMRNVFSSLGDPQNSYFRIVKSQTGRRIPIPISGDDPTEWEADGGRWDVTLESDVGFLKAGTEIDYTRYRRIYPKVTFQDYQELLVSIEYGWGDCGALYHFFLGRGKCLHKESEFTFWYPVGNPYVREKVKAYRWIHTSTKKEAGIEIPTYGDETAGVKGSSSGFIPWDEDSAPKEPNIDDFHPDHKNEPGGQRNGPFTGYGPIDGYAGIIKNLENVVSNVFQESNEEGKIDAKTFTKAFVKAYEFMELSVAEREINNVKQKRQKYV